MEPEWGFGGSGSAMLPFSENAPSEPIREQTPPRGSHPLVCSLPLFHGQRSVRPWVRLSSGALGDQPSALHWEVNNTPLVLGSLQWAGRKGS